MGAQRYAMSPDAQAAGHSPASLENLEMGAAHYLDARSGFRAQGRYPGDSLDTYSPNSVWS